MPTSHSDSGPRPAIDIPIPRPFKSGESIQNSVTFAYSCRENPRNLENPWYGPYTATLFKLVDFPTPIGTLSAEQQYNMALSSQQLEEVRLTKAELIERAPDGFSEASYRASSDEEDEESADAPGGPSSSTQAPRRSTRVKEKADKAKAKQVPKKSEHGKGKKPTRAAIVRKTLEDHRQMRREVSPPPPIPIAPVDQDDWDVNGFALDPAEISFQSSSVATRADKDAKENLPDLLLGHKQVTKMRKPRDTASVLSWARRLGAQARHQCFPLIGEIKRGPSRCARGDDLKNSILFRLAEAESDLMYYAAVYFTRDPHPSSVIGVSGAGGYWRWATIQREDVPSVRLASRTDDLTEKELAEVEDFTSRFNKRFEGREWHYLGTPESDKAWTKLRNEGLIPILQAHATDYPSARAGDVKGKTKIKQFPAGKSGSPAPSRILRRSTRKK